ncbi:hypothetical protein QFZ55_001744 [Streptomyces luteogriseus]|uniref:hypothetical protein n=1 Tax=Streptomyces luteogriseus TaxID=68233 RepID=UPI00278743A2|nr:hypothetical protein [Streptomyces luteogriseus]MDQ0712292.1 hypothetical protein [Streptomyces luteogriseus]
MVAVSLLVVVGVCWDRGEDPGGTVTALPPDFATAAHPAGSGTGTAAGSLRQWQWQWQWQWQ